MGASGGTDKTGRVLTVVKTGCWVPVVRRIFSLHLCVFRNFYI